MGNSQNRNKTVPRHWSVNIAADRLILAPLALSANFLIILKDSRVLMDLSFLHDLTHVPVNKGTLGIHQVKLVVQVSPGLSSSCSVAQHAHSLLYFGQISPGTTVGGWLVNNANFEEWAQSTNWIVPLVLMVAW